MTTSPLRSIFKTHRFNTSPSVGWASSSVTSTFRPHSMSHAMPSATKPGAHTRAEKRKGQKRTKMMVFYYMGRFLKKKRSTKKWCGVENCAKKESAPKSFAASQERNTMLGHHLSFGVLLDHTIVPSLKSSMAAPLLFCAHSQIWGKPPQNAPTTIHDSRSPPRPNLGI